jgi:hypothetical protein
MSSRFFGPRSFALGLLAVAVPAAVAVATAVPSAAALSFGAENEFHQTNLISDLGNQGAQVVDPNLQNAWGLAFSPTSPPREVHLLGRGGSDQRLEPGG